MYRKGKTKFKKSKIKTKKLLIISYNKFDQITQLNQKNGYKGKVTNKMNQSCNIGIQFFK